MHKMMTRLYYRWVTYIGLSMLAVLLYFASRNDLDAFKACASAVSMPAPSPSADPNSARAAKPFYCIRGEMQCTKGKRRCIPEHKYCDGKKDCDDGSDEGEHCVNHVCKFPYGKCPNKQLCTFVPITSWFVRVPRPELWYFCNGEVDCRDGSDEDPSFCKTFNCSQYQKGAVKCPSGHQCLWLNMFEDEEKGAAVRLCDGGQDCKDGSDEAVWYCSNRNCSDPSSYIRCDGGRCVHNYAVCNGRRECKDGTDELNCKSRPCPKGSRKCKDGQTCIREESFCDTFYKDCPDGSDESPEYCPKACPDLKNQYCADNRTCVAKTKFCDGKRDCPDGSDEDPEFANCVVCDPSIDQYQCPSGRPLKHCLSWDNFCNGRRDCQDGSDEKLANCQKIPCPEYVSKCADGGRCVTIGERCDGIYTCKDRSDEDPSRCRMYNCSMGYIKCPSGVGCISPGELCDRRRDCLDGSDESTAVCGNPKRCTRDEVRCRSTQRCTKGLYCDGVYDCRDGSDEDPQFCRNYTCLQDEWKCRDGVHCIGAISVCDGRSDCEDASDEDAAFCQSYNCTSIVVDSLVKCPRTGRKCVNGRLCDGHADCEDKSDEDASFCKEYQCPPGWWKCKDGVTCITYDNLCDGYPGGGCPDHSDEDTDVCSTIDCTEFGKVRCIGENNKPRCCPPVWGG